MSNAHLSEQSYYYYAWIIALCYEEERLRVSLLTLKKKKAKCVLKYWIMSFYCVFTVCVIAWNVRQADEGTDWNLLAPLFDPL